MRPIIAAAPRRVWAAVGWAGLAVPTFVGAAVLAAGCGGGPSGQRVASLGETSTTIAAATTSSTVPSGSKSNPVTTAVAFVSCMRTHGEANMPEPSVSESGGHTHVSIEVSSGVDPNSPLFAAAYQACRHLLPNDGGSSGGPTITSADQADYLKAAACMRAHGISDFPDPSFRNGRVSFTSRTPIDTDTQQFTSALTTCQKLIPAGLPYSSLTTS